MEAKYYIIIDGNQAGPFTAEALKYHGLRPDSMVWRQGLDNWVQASSLPELQYLFGYGAAPQPAMAQPQAWNSDPIPHTNWMPWAIVCTVLGVLSGCLTLILGIFAIVWANKANNYYNMGNEPKGRAANSTAKTLTIIGLVLGVISIIGSSIWLASGGMERYLETIQSLQNLR